VGLPLGVEDGELVTLGEFGSTAIATLVVTGVLVTELEVEPDAERFLPAKTVGGGMVAPLVPATRVMISPVLSANSMEYLSPSALAKAAISCLASLAHLSN
jgi:hypothetical protein